MPDCNKQHFYFFPFIRPLYFKKIHSLLVLFLTIHFFKKYIMGKKRKDLPLKIPFAFLWLDMCDQKFSEENTYLAPNEAAFNLGEALE